MDKSEMKLWINQLRDELDDIVRFWSESMPDHKNGGFLAGINTVGKVDDSGPKGVVLNARILWSFSSLSIHHNPDCRMWADRAYQYINEYFKDPVHSGYYWSVSQNGVPVSTKKQTYAQAFVLYALVEYYNLTHNFQALNEACKLFFLIEEYGYNEEYGGYIEAGTRNWKVPDDWRLSSKDLNEPMSLNTHLHVLEAYTSLFSVFPDPSVKSAIEKLQQLFASHFFRADGHLNLFFNRKWEPVGQLISYGHEIETTWLLRKSLDFVSYAPIIGDIAQWIDQALHTFLREAILPDGSVRYESDPATGLDDRDRHWWVQAESMIALLDYHMHQPEDQLLQSAHQIWQFIRNSLKDPRTGEWYWRLDSDGHWFSGDSLAGFWKCPYHNTRTCLESIDRLKMLL